ncbi:DUF4158 domain-containing protein [Subtercola sp. RTI3]|nr:DUF4158 domain-containing protein [Subtercola sp. RTI3]
MPRRTALSELEWERLLAVPESEEELAREYTFTSAELELIRRRRGDANRLGFAVLLAYVRMPGIALGTAEPAPQVLQVVASQVGIRKDLWAEYGRRDETRREHAVELQSALGMRRVTEEIETELLAGLEPIAVQTDKAALIAAAAIELLRSWGVLLPAAGTLDELVSTAMTAANRMVYATLADALTAEQKRALDGLLRPRADGQGTQLTWLRQSPLKPNSKHMKEHLDRLRAWREIGLPPGLRVTVRQNRLLKLAREGAQMSAGDLAKFEPQRRHATLAALAIESEATVTDEVIELHDRILGRVFNQAKNRYRDAFHDAGREINDKVLLFSQVGELLLAARDKGSAHEKEYPTRLEAATSRFSRVSGACGCVDSAKTCLEPTSSRCPRLAMAANAKGVPFQSSSGSQAREIPRQELTIKRLRPYRVIYAESWADPVWSLRITAPARPYKTIRVAILNQRSSHHTSGGRPFPVSRPSGKET